MEKRGVSPVIATVLLIAIVIVLALIVFLWARGFIPEALTKSGKSANQACEEIRLDLSYLSEQGELQISNTGNIPIYALKIKKKTGGDIEVQDEEIRISPGDTASRTIEGDYEELEIFPVVMAESGISKKIYTCQNSFIA